MADIGIDLGTTNSCVAHLRNTPVVIEVHGRQTMPSVVAWDEGVEEMLIGFSAKDQVASLPAIVSVKRDMGTDKVLTLGNNSYSPVDISAILLKEMIKEAEARLGEAVDSAVITIPAYFSGAQKEATQKAGEQAGLKSVRLLAEPIAAALAYGAEELVLVYDLGGGTFDVAIINCFDYKMLGLDGDNYLGGDDFDMRLVTHLAKEIKAKYGVDLMNNPPAKQIAKASCEKAKIELSQRTQTNLRFQGDIEGKVVNLTLKITRAEFEGLIEELVASSLEKVKGAIEAARKNDESFTKDSIETVLLVGGSTYIPMVRQRVSEFFGKPASTKVNPDLAVALGAAIHTASGPALKGQHRVRLDPVPMVTASTELLIKGRTSPGAKLEVSGGASVVSGNADDQGRISITVMLQEDKTNDISLVATDDAGQERKGGFQIRHDSNFAGEEEKGRRKAAGVGGGLLGRALGVGLTGEDDRLSVVVPSQTQLPCSIKSGGYQTTGGGGAGKVDIPIVEGDLPYGPLNTLLGVVQLDTPGTDKPEPLEITFQYNESHLLTVTARLTNYPDRFVKIQIEVKPLDGRFTHVVERLERVLNQHADKVRPEQKAKLHRAKQGLVDLTAQYAKGPSRELFQKIKDMGIQLRSELDVIEGLSPRSGAGRWYEQ